VIHHDFQSRQNPEWGVPKMKRMALFIVLGCAVASVAGCDEVKRRAGEAARGEAQRAADNVDRKARDAARNAADSAIDKGASGDDAAAADKRKKLKGGDEEDK
jgi:hypothetical protein